MMVMEMVMVELVVMMMVIMVAVVIMVLVTVIIIVEGIDSCQGYINYDYNGNGDRWM